MERKIKAVGGAGAVTTIIMWQLGYWLPEMMAAAPVGLEAAITTALALAAGWLVPNEKPEAE